MIITFGAPALDSSLSGATDFSAASAAATLTANGAVAAGGAATSAQLQVVFRASGGVTVGGAALAAVLTVPGAGAALTGWDVPISSGLGNVQFPREIAYDNAISLLIGPIRGLNVATAAAVLWPGAAITGWLAIAEDSDVPLGGSSKLFSIVPGTAQAIEYFTALEVTAALDAAALIAPLVNGQRLYAIVTGGSDFRRAVPFVYRAAIQVA